MRHFNSDKEYERHMEYLEDKQWDKKKSKKT